MVVHAFNLSTREAEAGGFLSSRTARATQRNPVSKQQQQQQQKTKKKKEKKISNKKKKTQSLSIYWYIVFSHAFL